ncbi:aspartate ammonia-lyase [Marinomonas sp. S3726]|uniref:aspartate ammonia-lyase n=1 Tax=Marinomonas sp. S3726 TaxID=579484 RepID=UPI000B1A14BC
MTVLKKIIKSVLPCDTLNKSEFDKLVQLFHSQKLKQGEMFQHDLLSSDVILLVSGQCQLIYQDIQKHLDSPSLCNPFIGDDSDTALRNICVVSESASFVSIKRQALSTWLDINQNTALLSHAFLKLEMNRLNAQVLDVQTFRTEKDLLGVRQVEESALYGIQTLRAQENFAITDIKVKHFPQLVSALAMVKKAAANANHKLGLLSQEHKNAIGLACDEIIGGEWHEHFVVDVIQGGAGTSTNMNANEVIANRALEIMGHKRGEYQYLHPNNHVNLSQSTNDAYPTAIRLAILLSHQDYVDALSDLCYQMKQKAVEFSDVIKMGRTQLQDAVPITLGQEFDAWYFTMKEDISEVKDVIEYFREINLGATAIGTGINTDPDYSSLAIEELCRISGKELVRARNLIEATSDMGAFVTFSSVLKRNAVKLSKICNDLRLMSSGPRAGLQEINLPAMQPGSSIMPGKVNPVIPEMVNQVAFQIIGNDITITMASEAGQLQLNVMEPVIVFNVLQSLRLQVRAVSTLSQKCIKGITANVEHCLNTVNHSIGIITALNPFIGYENATRIAKQALDESASVRDLILAEGLLSEQALDDVLSVENMTAPRKMRVKEAMQLV